MNKTFIKTKNVKRFISLMDELQKLPPNIPKLALVYGDHGLGKSQAIQWWADKNDAVYVRASQGMTCRCRLFIRCKNHSCRDRRERFIEIHRHITICRNVYFPALKD